MRATLFLVFFLFVFAANILAHEEPFVEEILENKGIDTDSVYQIAPLNANNSLYATLEEVYEFNTTNYNRTIHETTTAVQMQTNITYTIPKVRHDNYTFNRKVSYYQEKKYTLSPILDHYTIPIEEPEKQEPQLEPVFTQTIQEQWATEDTKQRNVRISLLASVLLLILLGAFTMRRKAHSQTPLFLERHELTEAEIVRKAKEMIDAGYDDRSVENYFYSMQEKMKKMHS